MNSQYNNDLTFAVSYAGPIMWRLNYRVVVNHKGVHYECEMVDVDTSGKVQFDFHERIKQTNKSATRGVYFGDNNWYTHLRLFVIEQDGKRYAIYGDNVSVSDDVEVTLVNGDSCCV